MIEPSLGNKYSPPVAIGGVGGSGTRVIAAFLEHLGFYIGEDLNPPKDNLWFTYFFNNYDAWKGSDSQLSILCSLFYRSMQDPDSFSSVDRDFINQLISIDRNGFSATWAKLRNESLLNAKNSIQKNQQWGWKEPNTHLFIDRLAIHFPQLKYIHVIRHGVDMAFSQNQNQLVRWGSHLLEEDIEINAKNSLRYWCAVHKRLKKTQEQFGNQFYLLNFDNLCSNPRLEISNLLAFLSIEANDLLIESMGQLINKPKSIGRHAREDLSLFYESDLKFVKQLGFEVKSN